MTATAPKKPADAPRWVACSAKEFGPPGFVRHLVRPGGIDTVCATSATHPEIWRGNTTKPKCKACAEWEESNRGR